MSRLHELQEQYKTTKPWYVHDATRQSAEEILMLGRVRLQVSRRIELHFVFVRQHAHVLHWFTLDFVWNCRC